MKVYSPSETAELLGIKTATLRKYSLLLESKGYEIARNSKRHRYYKDKDVMTIRTVITASNSGVTLHEAVSNVVNLKGRSNESNETYNAQSSNGSDMQQLKEMIITLSNKIDKQDNKTNKQNEYLIKQNELIGNLINRIDQQDEYISNNLTAPFEQKKIEGPKEVEEAQKESTSRSSEKDKEKSLFSKILDKFIINTRDNK